MRLDESVGIAGAERPTHQRLPDRESVARPSLGRLCGPLVVGLQTRPELGQARLPENASVGRGGTVEPVQLRRQLEFHQALRKFRRIGRSRLAGPKVKVGQPLRETAQPAVGVVDVLHGLVGAAMGVLGQPGRGVVMAGIAEIIEGVDHLVDPCGPAGGLVVGHEAPARGRPKRPVDAAAPLSEVGARPPSGPGIVPRTVAPIRASRTSACSTRPSLA